MRRIRLIRRYMDVPVPEIQLPSGDVASAAVANMAIDSALADLCRDGDSPTLRIYRWPKPTLSLGYFQPSADRQFHSPSQSIEMVRRSSGGGAIVHDYEWTYSLVMPNTAIEIVRRAVPECCDDTSVMYRSLHRSLIDSMASAGIVAWREGDRPRSPGSEDSFLCFQRRNEHDLIVAGYKIAGSAQRRFRHARLQHGSILWRASPHAPELPGILDLSGETIDPRGWMQTWSLALAAHWKCGIEPTVAWSPAVVARSRQIASSQFGDDAWRMKR